MPTDSDRPRRANRFASIDLALDRRLDTVPTGQPSCSAACRWLLPPNSHRTMVVRYFSGRRLNSRSRASASASRRSSRAAIGSGISDIWISRTRRLDLIDLAFMAVWYATP